ncbi:hypothetical protein HMPREF9318_00619 [Streptococcus urinalis FB127-CNA-2]|uniref:YbbR-like protein n=1 Tax=Streptococcus urinalis 2285-97 TaxID=764291 RepID=G5KGY1_9STRE|nr:CdaR family protein [Streptococcus urinalis]EHJ56100.1 YbbR-like protein [Streptococcus urinalis 2285-97]EKS22421.1 hypothetical protein HMPREF9318_00619 [Streptococcus urinalis FB127-CNA-2]VEF32234.1 YbbR-like signal peptide containing protein [Streptococcus urinalis]
MKKFFTSKFWTICVSLFFALILFITAASTNYSNATQSTSSLETYTHTLSNVPIDIKYNSDKYFISGYSYEAEVYLSSTNRVKLDKEINPDTRNFKVVADLSGSKAVGSTNAKLKVTNLPSGVTATVVPSTISVTIGKKVTKTFNIQGRVDSSQIASGYQLKKLSTEISQADVTSDESTIERIDHVVAKLPDDKIINKDYSGQVTLQAVASDGTILASIIDPAKTTLEVSVKKITKSVPIRIETSGQMSDKVSDLEYKMSQDSVVISGTQSAVNAINEVVAHVDISDITKNTSKTVNLKADKVSVDPSSVTVQIKTKKN